MKIYQIKRFTGKFPQRLRKDPVVKTADTLKVAQVICIELNEKLNERFYVEEKEVL